MLMWYSLISTLNILYRDPFRSLLRKLLLSGGSPGRFSPDFLPMSSPVYRVLDAGTTDSGAVVVPNADVVVADADVVESAEANVLNPDVNNAARGDDVDLVSENGSSVHEIGQEMPRSSVNVNHMQQERLGCGNRPDAKL